MRAPVFHTQTSPKTSCSRPPANLQCRARLPRRAAPCGLGPLAFLGDYLFHPRKDSPQTPRKEAKGGNPRAPFGNPFGQRGGPRSPSVGYSPWRVFLPGRMVVSAYSVTPRRHGPPLSFVGRAFSLTLAPLAKELSADRLTGDCALVLYLTIPSHLLRKCHPLFKGGL